MVPEPDIVVAGANPFTAGVPLGDWQLARAFHELGHRVLFVDPPRRLSSVAHRRHPRVTLWGPRPLDDGMWVLTPTSPFARAPWRAPVIGDRLVDAQVNRALTVLGMRCPLLLTVKPERGSFAGVRSGQSVYWQKDRQWASPGLPRPEWSASRHHEVLVAATLAMGVSPEIVADGAARGRVVHHVPNGVDLDAFAPITSEPQELVGRPRPRAVIAGAWGWRADVELLDGLAARHPEVLFVMVGRVEAPVPSRPNVLCLGNRPYSHVPAVLRACDVGLVLYRQHVFNEASAPLKTLEYLAAGLGVVSVGANLPQGSSGVAVRVAGLAETSAALQEMLRRPGAADRARAVAAVNSWTSRATAVLSLASSAGPAA